ncbi:hypothetical protein O9993_06550 [Vibrio lentus]|nr:hypothetical protein [Vibrio lentus]
MIKARGEVIRQYRFDQLPSGSKAKANVAPAQLDLLEEQRQGRQAKSEWQRSGLSDEPDSPWYCVSHNCFDNGAPENAKA